MSKIISVSENIRIFTFPLSIMGMEIGRNVTAIRLASGDLILHSTGPFDPDFTSAVAEFGNPRWLVDNTNFHDTYTKEGTATYPDLPYLVPEGFRVPEGIASLPLEVQPEWESEIQLFRIGGMPKINETVFYHLPSKALIVADLLFNISPGSSKWTRLGMSAISAVRPGPCMSRLYRSMIKDDDAFTESLKPILDLDFEVLIVAHGAPITEHPHQILKSELRSHGYKV